MNRFGSHTIGLPQIVRFDERHMNQRHRLRTTHAYEINAGKFQGFGPSVPELVVILQTQMRDEFLTAQVAERVLEFHQLDEQVVLRVEAARVDRTLEIE